MTPNRHKGERGSIEGRSEWSGAGVHSGPRRERLKGEAYSGLMSGESGRDGGHGWPFKGGPVGRIWRRLVGGCLTPAAAGRIGGVMMGWGANVVWSGQDLELRLSLRYLRARDWGGQPWAGERGRAPAGIPASLPVPSPDAMFSQQQQQQLQQLQQQQLQQQLQQQQQLLQLQQLLQQSPPQAPLAVAVSR